MSQVNLAGEQRDSIVTGRAPSTSSDELLDELENSHSSRIRFRLGTIPCWHRRGTTFTVGGTCFSWKIPTTRRRSRMTHCFGATRLVEGIGVTYHRVRLKAQDKRRNGADQDKEKTSVVSEVDVRQSYDGSTASC